jgi:hypothetical protein
METEKYDTQPGATLFNKSSVGVFIITLVSSALLVFVTKIAEGIHLPYLVAVLGSISIGIVEPRKGWIFAILHAVFILVGYFLFASQAEGVGRQEMESFSIYGGILLGFIGSFIGGFFKRAMTAE